MPCSPSTVPAVLRRFKLWSLGGRFGFVFFQWCPVQPVQTPQSSIWSPGPGGAAQAPQGLLGCSGSPASKKLQECTAGHSPSNESGPFPCFSGIQAACWHCTSHPVTQSLKILWSSRSLSLPLHALFTAWASCWEPCEGREEGMTAGRWWGEGWWGHFSVRIAQSLLGRTDSLW